MFLTDLELKDMTGYVNHSRQAAWLSDNGYKFDVRSDGRPNVLIEQVRQRQLGAAANSKPGPDFTWLEKVG